MKTREYFGLRGTACRRGVTLIEMIVVIVILVMLLGLSLAIFKNANRDLGVRAAAHHVVGLCRGAHDYSRRERSPSWFVINPKENSAYLLTKETVGEWHFEDTVTTGAFGHNGAVTNAMLVPGRIGMGMRMVPNSTIKCGDIPVYKKDQGIAIEFWYHRLSAAQKQILCSIGEQVEIAVEGSGRLTARVGLLTLNSRDVYLRQLNTWYSIQLIYNGREGQLILNDGIVDQKAAVADWTKNSPLIIGSSNGGMDGIVDEFRVSLIFAREPYILPSEAKFVLPQGARLENGEFVVRFDSAGRLAAPNPVTFAIKSPTDEKQITINPTGSVQR